VLLRTLVLALALAGCSPAPAPPPPPPSPMPIDGMPPVVDSLTLGFIDGDGAFVPYLDGEDVTLVEGAQGGFHVWMAYAYGGGVSDPSAKLSRGAERLSDGEIVLRTSAPAVLLRQSDPLPMFMCPSPIGLSVIDQPIVFSISLSNDAGPIAAGTTTLVPRCPDANRDFCLRICTG
jgi:hypothetical protein